MEILWAKDIQGYYGPQLMGDQDEGDLPRPPITALSLPGNSVTGKESDQDIGYDNYLQFYSPDWRDSQNTTGGSSKTI